MYLHRSFLKQRKPDVPGARIGPCSQIVREEQTKSQENLYKQTKTADQLADQGIIENKKERRDQIQTLSNNIITHIEEEKGIDKVEDTRKLPARRISSSRESPKKRISSSFSDRDERVKRRRHSSASSIGVQGLSWVPGPGSHGTRQERRKQEEMNIWVWDDLRSTSRSASRSPGILGESGLCPESYKEEKYKLIASMNFAEDARKLLEAPLISSNNQLPDMDDRGPNPVLKQSSGHQSWNKEHDKRRRERSKSKSEERTRSRSSLQPKTEALPENETNLIPLLCSGPSQALTQVTAYQPGMSPNMQRSLFSNNFNASEQDSSAGNTKNNKNESPNLRICKSRSTSKRRKEATKKDRGSTTERKQEKCADICPEYFGKTEKVKGEREKNKYEWKNITQKKSRRINQMDQVKNPKKSLKQEPENTTTTEDANYTKARRSLTSYSEKLGEQETNTLPPIHLVRCGGSWHLTAANSSIHPIKEERALCASSFNEYIEPEEIAKHETQVKSEFEIFAPTLDKRPEEDVLRPQISIVESDKEKRAIIKAGIPTLDWKPEMEKFADMYLDFKKVKKELANSDEVDELLLQISLLGCKNPDELMSVIDDSWNKSPTKEAWTEIFSDLFPLIKLGAIPEFPSILNILLFAYQELKEQEPLATKDGQQQPLSKKTVDLE